MHIHYAFLAKIPFSAPEYTNQYRLSTCRARIATLSRMFSICLQNCASDTMIYDLKRRRWKKKKKTSSCSFLKSIFATRFSILLSFFKIVDLCFFNDCILELYRTAASNSSPCVAIPFSQICMQKPENFFCKT